MVLAGRQKQGIMSCSNLALRAKIKKERRRRWFCPAAAPSLNYFANFLAFSHITRVDFSGTSS
jgi:hypothetical protein